MEGDQEPVIAIIGEQYCGGGERELTVHKTSVFYPDDGYAAYDHRTGELAFRVDTYALAHNLVLMDPAGTPILTFRHKWLSLHQRWEGFLGDKTEGQKPLFSVRRSSIFGHDRGVMDVEFEDDDREYRIEGSFAQRICRIVMCRRGSGGQGEEEAVVAEIRRKLDACSHVMMLGKDVFSVSVRPGFDVAFAMALVLVLDQISGDDDDCEGEVTRGVDSCAVDPVADDDDVGAATPEID